MKTNTFSSKIIALLMMMLFSHASHAATIIPQNGTVSQLTPVYRDSDPVEYYAEALADVETLVRFYTYLFSFFLCLFEEMDDGQGEMRKSAVAIIARGESVAFLSRLVILVFGRRARLFLGALWMMMGVRNSKFRAGK